MAARFHSLIAKARPAAFAAAVFAATTGTALVADAQRIAAAQGRLDAEYVATISGVSVGHGNWTVELSEREYSASASGATAGVLKFLTGARGTSAAHGTVNGGQPMATSYSATIIDDRRIDQVHMVLAGGTVLDYSAEPPMLPLPDRIPVTDADRHGVFDPLTSTLAHVAGSGDPVSADACHRTVSVFDGRIRYDLRSEFKRIETVKAEKGYAGPVVVCAVYFTPVSGYVPDRAAIKYLVELRDAEVWLAPIAGTRVLAPYRFTMPTPLGPAVLQATQFVSTVLPVHASATTQ